MNYLRAVKIVVANSHCKLTANPNPHFIQMFNAPNTLTSLPSVLLPYSVWG